MFEIAGAIRKFAERARQIEGFEFLFDEQDQLTPDDDFHYIDKKGNRKSGKATLYAVTPSNTSLRRLVRRYQEYSRGDQLKGAEAYRELFDQLIILRPWGPRDRLPEATREAWLDLLEDAPDQPVRLEAELIYRENEDDRRQAATRLQEVVKRAGGSIISFSLIPEIRYHSALVETPAAALQKLLDEDRADLVSADDIFMLRPEPCTMFPIGDDESKETIAEPVNGAGGDLKTAVAALFDGVPMQAHQLLRNHIVVEDPWDLQAEVPVEARAHGTGMASLIIHGDLHEGKPSISRQLVSQPLMTAEQDFLGQWRETLPRDRLPADVLYEAIQRLKSGYGDEDPTNPEVVIINHSLGDYSRPYVSQISPWGKLLDWLAYRHRLLFIVSAGNIMEPIKIDDYKTVTAFEDDDPIVREKNIARALIRDRNARTILSPAEAVNVLTIGAGHVDSFENAPVVTTLIDPKPSVSGTNLSSAVGHGHAGCIKPEIVAPGGRELVRWKVIDGACYVSPAKNASLACGQKQARPSADDNAVWNKCGTSNAAALTTRAAIELYDVLEDLGNGDIHNIVDAGFEAVVLKALLVHGTGWGMPEEATEEILKAQFDYDTVAARKEVTRFGGYGEVNFERVKACTSRRATTISFGELRKEQEALIELPLPTSLESIAEVRFLRITLAWLTPINARFSGYRRAKLSIDPVDKSKIEDVVGSQRLAKVQPDYHQVKRGTVTHEMFSGNSATPFIHDGMLRLRVACPNPNDQDLDDSVPFAVVTSLEVGEDSKVAVYDEVKIGIQELIRVRQYAPS